MNNIENRIKNVVSKILNITTENIFNHSLFVQDLGADSLDIVELIMALEEEFDVEISDAESEKINTIQHAIDYIKRRHNC